MRINVTIPDDLKLRAEQRSKSLGVSLSAFVRLLLARETGKLSMLDRELLEIENEGFEKANYQSFRKDLKKMISNAKA